ncbi:ATP-binding cassette domain-containing protein, partial [Vibrio makurazakiensis]|uniref:ATP-binding cassette domain-containing protein n=1 Tax=Vibrio makurazakiensis TaxID=2910250 RepID=UPI003D0A8FFA
MSNVVIQYTQTLGESEFDIDLELPNKGITAIFGRSGAGKTSLINAISGLSKPRSGKIEIDGNVVFNSVEGVNLPTYKR